MSRGDRLRNLVSVLVRILAQVPDYHKILQRNIALSQQEHELFQDPESPWDKKSELARITSLGKCFEHFLLALSNDLRSIMSPKIYSTNLECPILENTIIPVKHSHLRVYL